MRPGGWREVGPVIAAFASVAGRVTGTRQPALFLTLGRHRGLFWGWLHFAGRLMLGGRLARREAELVILRVADELVAERDISDVLWAELGRLFDEQERIELVLLVGHYAMLATVLKAFRVPADEPRDPRPGNAV